MKTICVTGANGYLGQAFVRAGYKPLACNVMEPNSIERSLSLAKPDAVLHLAAKSDPDWCERNDSFGVNVMGTRNVADACREKLVPIVFLSSRAVPLPAGATHVRAS